MKLLICYDGSLNGDKMLANLTCAGLPACVEAKILCIAEVWQTSAVAKKAVGNRLEVNLAEMEQCAARAHKQLINDFPDWIISNKTIIGDPVTEILLVATTWQPDLIVMGNNGLKGLEKFVLGSVSQKIVNEAPTSVRIARGFANNKPVRIIIGVDGSDGAANAVKMVQHRKWPANSEVRLVTAISPVTILRLNELDQEMAQNIQKPIETELCKLNLAVTAVIKVGEPAQVLIDEANKWQANNIFVGSRGLGKLKRFWLGSVSSAVVAEANCTVEIVRD